MEPSSPPSAGDLGTGVRRHQSLTHGHQNREPGAGALMRAATHGKANYRSRRTALDSQTPEVPPVPDQYLSSSLSADGHDENPVSPPSGSPGIGGGRWGPQSSSSPPSANNNSWAPSPPQHPVGNEAQDDLQRSFAGLDVGGGSNRVGQPNAYYQNVLYGTTGSSTLAQPQPNPNHLRKLSPPTDAGATIQISLASS